jgi:hypothetical protein
MSESRKKYWEQRKQSWLFVYNITSA